MKYLKLIQFLFFLSLVGQSLAQTSQIDSLKAVLESSKEDTSKVNTLIAICVSERRSSPADAILYGQEALDLSEKLNYGKGMAMAHKYIGMGHYFQGDYWETILRWQQSLTAFEAINDKIGVSNLLNNIGAVYNNQGDDTKALEYYLRSLKAAKEAADSSRIAIASINIGTIYLKKIETNDKALEYYLSVLHYIETRGTDVALGAVSANMGDIYYEREEYDTALYYYEKSLSAFQESNVGNIPYAMTSIGRVYMKRGEFQRAIVIQEEGYEIAKQSDAKLEMSANLLGLADTYTQQGDVKSAISTYKRAQKIAEEIGALYELRRAYEGLVSAYTKMSEYNNAFKYQALVTDIKDTLYVEANDRKIQSLQFNHELVKQAQIHVWEQQSRTEQLKSRRQKAIMMAIGSVGLIIMVLAIRFYKQTQYVKKINVQVNDQKDEIETQRDEIEAQRDEIEAQRDEVETQRDQLKIQRDLVVKQKDEIIDSINYAHKIQSALMPPKQYFYELLNDVFILYKPRDIVSGDFYWIKQVNNYIILVVADCTGHGVPGALMSMLGISYLNEIVNRREITQANQILNELRTQIMQSLRQHGQPDEAKDGIDMALCVIDKKNRTLQYSGANNPIYLIRDNNGTQELTEIKADRMPLGYYQGKFKTFTNNDIQLEYGNVFYIFSDGFVDQKGGNDNKKYLSKNFKKLLFKIHEEPMQDQKRILDKTIADWIGDNSQIDDILIIGVRV